MRCPNCHKAVRPTQIKQLKVKGCLREFKCPQCDTWLANNPMFLRTKIISCYGALSCGVASYNFFQYEHILYPLGILGFVIMLAVHMMDQLHKIDAPTPDHS